MAGPHTHASSAGFSWSRGAGQWAGGSSGLNPGPTAAFLELALDAATSPAGHPQLPAAAAGRPVHKTATIENDQQGCKGNRGTRDGIVAKPFLMECHP